MASLYISDSPDYLANLMFGDPIKTANNLVSNADFESALRYAFGDTGSGSTTNLVASSATAVSFIVNQPGSNQVKVELTGTGFNASATTLAELYSNSSNFTINSIRAIDGGASNTWASPLATVQINGAVVVKAARLTSFSVTGVKVQSGDASVTLDGTLSVPAVVDNGGNYQFDAGSWTDAKVAIVYDTNPSPTVKNFARVTLEGDFAFSSGAEGGQMSGTSSISKIAFEVFGDNETTESTPIHAITGDNLNITGAELSASEDLSVQVALRTIFESSNDTVYTSADTPIPEGFENVVIQGITNVDVDANGLNNLITGNSGNNVIDGAGGTDTFITSGTLSSALLNADGSIEIKTSTGGTDTLYHVEKIQVGNAAAVDAMSLVSGMRAADTFEYQQGSGGSTTFFSSSFKTGDGIVPFGSANMSWGTQGLKLADGRLLAVTTDFSSPYDGGMARVLNADGTISATFQVGGNNGSADRGEQSLVQLFDGRVVIGSRGDGTLAFSVWDPKALDDVPVTNIVSGVNNIFSPYESGPLKLIAAPGGGLYAVATTNQSTGSPYGQPQITIAKLSLNTSAGSGSTSLDLDPNFSADGIYQIAGDGSALKDVTVDSTGNLWVVGTSSTGTSTAPVLYKINTGSGEPSYQTVRDPLTSFEGSDVLGVQTYTTTIAGAATTKVYVAYTTSNWTYTGSEGGSGGVAVEVLRLNQDGTVDNTFGTNGKVVIESTGDSSTDFSLAQHVIDVDSSGNLALAFNRYWGVQVVKVSSAGEVNVLTDGGDPYNSEPYISVAGADGYNNNPGDIPNWVELNNDGSVLVGVAEYNYGYNTSSVVAMFDSSGGLAGSFDETSNKVFTLTTLDGSAAPNWVTLDTSGVDPKIVVSSGTTDADAGHNYFVLTARGSTSVSRVFDVYIKPLDAGTNDTYTLDTTMVSAGSRIVPLDMGGNPSPMGLDTLDLSGSDGLVGASSDIIVDAKNGEIVYWADGAASSDPVSYTFEGFEKYVLGASTGYFIGRDDLSEYVVIKGGQNYDIVLGSSLSGQIETDIISFEGGQSGVEIALSNADDPNTFVTAKVGTGTAITHQISGAEGVIGSEAADKITGNYADNFLIGNGGNDEISGGEGDDVLVGGAGAGDKLFGGAGGDWLIDLDGGTLRGNEVKLAPTDKANAQKDAFVVNKGATIENFQLSESGTGLAGRAQNANDAIVFNLNLGVIAGLDVVKDWSWVNYDDGMTTAQKEAFSAAVSSHVKFKNPVETTSEGVTSVKLELWMYETLNSDGTLNGREVKVGETTIADVKKASGDQLVIVGLNGTGYRTADANLDSTSFPSLGEQTLFSKSEAANIAIALESVKAGTIRQLPGQVVMSAKWDGTPHFYNPAGGNQKIIATNASDTVELLVQTLADANSDGKGEAGSDKVYDIGGDDTLSFSNAKIEDLHFEAVMIGREVGNQSLKVSYAQTNGKDTNVGDLTWTGHFRSGVDMALDQVTVADVGGTNVQATYQMADTVYKWDKGVFKGVDLVAQAGEDTIMVGQDNTGKTDRFVIKDGFTSNTTVETTDIYIWGLDSNATTANNKTNTLDKIDLSDFGLLDSRDIDTTDTANQTMTVSIANSAGTAADKLVIHLMDTNLTTLEDILVYQTAAA